MIVVPEARTVVDIGVIELACSVVERQMRVHVELRYSVNRKSIEGGQESR
jgi:hypothetical protein